MQIKSDGSNPYVKRFYKERSPSSGPAKAGTPAKLNGPLGPTGHSPLNRNRRQTALPMESDPSHLNFDGMSREQLISALQTRNVPPDHIVFILATLGMF